MSAWWWVLIVPVAYVLIGWLIAWVWASKRVEGRPGCRHCGRRPYHSMTCGCETCLAYACDDHNTEESGLIVAIWPLWVAVEGGHRAASAARRVGPGAVVERKAERKRMHVLIRADKKVEDTP